MLLLLRAYQLLMAQSVFFCVFGIIAAAAVSVFIVAFIVLHS